MSYAKIFPGFYIGDHEISNDKQVVDKELNLTHILTIVEKKEGKYEPHPYDFTYLILETGSDADQNDLIPMFKKANEFIEEGRKDGSGVFVNSTGGNSLSATFCMAYIVWKLKASEVTLKDAFELVRDAKKNAKPTPYQAQQLKAYHQLLKDGTSAPKVEIIPTPSEQEKTVANEEDVKEKDDKSEVEVMDAKKENKDLESQPIINHEDVKSNEKSEEVKPEETTTNVTDNADTTVSVDQSAEDNKEQPTLDSDVSETPNVTYHCRKCRIQLFEESDILPHEQGKGQLAFEYHKRASMENDDEYNPVTCTSFFINSDTVEWTIEQALSNEGRLLCPKCSSRVGTWKWDGAQCSCGAWQTPSFQIAKKLVDSRQRNNAVNQTVVHLDPQILQELTLQ